MKYPKFSFWVLKKLLPRNDSPNLEGNFQELYKLIFQKKGKVYATTWIWGEIIKSFPGLFSATFFWRFTMFKNYLKIALRNLKRNKTYSFLNLSGLAVGMAGFILILLYIQFELSFDKYHKNAGRIYRVAWELPHGHTHSGKTTATGQFAVLGPTLVKEFPEVISSVRLKKDSDTLISLNNDSYLENNVYFTDPEIFNVFSFLLVKGNPKTALTNSNSVILSQTMARKYFGDQNPMGKTIQYGTKHTLKITGVLKNIPGNSHFTMDFIIPFKKYEQLVDYDLTKWNYRICLTYLLLSKNANPEELTKKLPAFFKKHKPDLASSGRVNKHFLQPLTKIHLYSNCDGELGVNNDIKNIYIFFSIAFLILIIACINYMNLATARSAQRGKEVGIRKVVGAQRRQLIQQFVGESMVLTVIALVLAITLVTLALPVYNSFTEREMAISFENSHQLSLLIIPVVIFVILFAGSYPAFYISSYPPVSTLKGSFKGSLRGRRLRSVLVVSQFSISIILIISTMVIKNQINFMIKTDVGYNKEQILTIRTNKESHEKLEVIKNELKKHSNILSISSSTYLPSQIDDQSNLDWPERPKDLAYFDIYMNIVDYDFVNLYEMEIVEGRNFSKDFPSDARGAFILNESLVKTLGWDSPIGKEVTRPRFRRSSIKGKVVGVVKNFNFHSLHRDIQPLFLFLDPKDRQYRLSVRLKGTDIKGTVQFIEKKIKEFAPSYPVEYSFFDDIFNKAYKSEQKIGGLINVFAVLGIFIASLGLFGLAAFTAEQRTKEIGIRKLLGARVSGIVILLSNEFSKWILISNIIAWPVAWFIMYKWLQNFAYRIPLGLWFFVFSAVIALFVALLTIVAQTLKAARAKPVDSLKYE